MDTITQLIASGKELFERFTLPGDPDWQGEAANIPDDAYPEEDGDGHAVAAADASKLGEMMARMEALIERGKLLDDDAIASLLAAAWVRGAKDDPATATGDE